MKSAATFGRLTCHKLWAILCRHKWLRLLPFFCDDAKDWNLEKTIMDYSSLAFWIEHSALTLIIDPVLQATSTSVCHLQIKPSVKWLKLISFKSSSNVKTYNLDHVHLVICHTLWLLGWLFKYWQITDSRPTISWLLVCVLA